MFPDDAATPDWEVMTSDISRVRKRKEGVQGKEREGERRGMEAGPIQAAL